MKKIIYCLSSIFILFTGCVQDEKDLFDDPSNIRIQKTLEECQEILLSAENGWLLEYYMNTNYYGGYFLNVDIHKDYEVTLKIEEVLTNRVQEFTDSDIEEATSTYALKKDDGPVFSFDTYNPFIHLFAEPLDDGNGFRGDYEFLIVEATSEKIILKGKKRKDYSFLYKVPSDMTGVEYREAILKNESVLFPEGLITYWYIIEGADTLYIEGLDRFFQTSEDAYFDTYNNLGAAPTLNGIHFNPAIEFKNNNYSYFTFSSDKSTLIAEENENIVITSIPSDEFFNKENNWKDYCWKFNGNMLGGEFLTSYQKINEAVLNYRGVDLEYLSLYHVTDEREKRNNRVFSFTVDDGTSMSKGTTGYFDIETSFTKDTESEFAIKYLGTMDRYVARLFSTRVPELEEFLNLLEVNSPYYMEAAASALNPTDIRLTSKTNPNNWFIVNLTKQE